MNVAKHLAFVLPVSILTACMPLTPNLDSNFGKAVNQAKAQQTLNPDASRNTSVQGMSGKESGLIIEGYHETLKAPPAPTSVINIGGGLGGSGAQ